MAAPHAAGVAALIVAQHGRTDTRKHGMTLEPDRVQQILEQTAVAHACPVENPLVYSDPLSTAAGIPPARCAAARTSTGSTATGSSTR